uniref:Chromo domain-containing protein n=1 Tax=Panagrolaimus sp. ES5 TaxID=591445 RepID=A0AC34GP69_9BILA
MSGAAGNSKAREVPADDGIYTIEKIIKHRNDKKKGRMFFIKWQGWAPSHNTWEPEANILDKDLVTKYLETVKSPRSKKGAKRSGESSANSTATSPPPAQRPRRDSEPSSNNIDSRDNSASPELDRNSFGPTRPAETEGHFDKGDEDKDKVEQPTPPKQQQQQQQPKPALPTLTDTSYMGLQQEDVSSPEPEPEEPPQPIPTEPEEQKQEESKKETEGNGPFELFGYFPNGESGSFKITKQEHPNCAIKIQVNNQPIVTLPGEDDPNSNLVSVPLSEATPLIEPTQTVVSTESEFVQGPGASTFESQTASGFFF